MFLRPGRTLSDPIHRATVVCIGLFSLLFYSGPVLSTYTEQEKVAKDELSARQSIARAARLPSEKIPAVVQSVRELPWNLYAQQKKERAESLVRSVLALKKLRPHDPL